MFRSSLLLLWGLAIAAYAQTPYKPTEEELKQEELGKRMRDRTIDPTDFFKQAFGTEIRFYGQVVDWDGVPVEGATVKYIMSSDVTSLGGREAKCEMISGKEGLFEIKGKGIDLYVSVRKGGYRTVKTPPPFANKDAPGGRFGSSKGFDYFNGEGHPERNHHPVEGQPVQFVIRKIGAIEPLVHLDESFPLTSDGRSRAFSLQGEAAVGHRIGIICRSDCQGAAQKKDYNHFNWSFELVVEDGGIVAQADEGFEAPLSGYVPSVILASVNASDARWISRFNEKKYYIRFNDGVCARIIVEGRASYVVGENKPFIYLESYLNPNPKSRNLETPPPGR